MLLLQKRLSNKNGINIDVSQSPLGMHHKFLTWRQFESALGLCNKGQTMGKPRICSSQRSLPQFSDLGDKGRVHQAGWFIKI